MRTPLKEVLLHQVAEYLDGKFSNSPWVLNTCELKELKMISFSLNEMVFLIKRKDGVKCQSAYNLLLLGNYF